jgi:TorA maturation chaperone TorD
MALPLLRSSQQLGEMRDQGLQDAIRAAGGVEELACLLGMPQSSVTTWERVPEERVLAVEGVTGVACSVLRPDLFAAPSTASVDETDAARAQEYALLATLLARSPAAHLMARLARLRGDASALGAAHAVLGEAAARADIAEVEREYFDLFIGLGRGDLLPYASYYLTGFLHGRPLARLRADLSRLGLEQTEGQSEPEDHAASLCEIMAMIAGGSIQAPVGTDRELFEKHLAPWIRRFFTDLEQCPRADFYARVGALGRTFVDIETEAFALQP